MSEENVKILRVTMTVDYYIEMHDANRSLVNGWTIEEIVEDWFKKHGHTMYHATRDAHEIGGSKKYISSEVVEFPEKDNDNESNT